MADQYNTSILQPDKTWPENLLNLILIILKGARFLSTFWQRERKRTGN